MRYRVDQHPGLKQHYSWLFDAACEKADGFQAGDESFIRALCNKKE
jgi:hypothetical protein